MFNGVEMNVNFSMKSAVAMLRIKSRISCIVPSSPDKLDDGKGRGGADGGEDGKAGLLARGGGIQAAVQRPGYPVAGVDALAKLLGFAAVLQGAAGGAAFKGELAEGVVFFIAQML